MGAGSNRSGERRRVERQARNLRRRTNDSPKTNCWRAAATPSWRLVPSFQKSSIFSRPTTGARSSQCAGIGEIWIFAATGHPVRPCLVAPRKKNAAECGAEMAAPRRGSRLNKRVGNARGTPVGIAVRQRSECRQIEHLLDELEYTTPTSVACVCTTFGCRPYVKGEMIRHGTRIPSPRKSPSANWPPNLGACGGTARSDQPP